MRGTSAFLGAALFLWASVIPAFATDWHVAPGGSGGGTIGAPFGRIQDAINAAQPGDVVVVAPGLYSEALSSVRAGTSESRIAIRARDARGSTIVTVAGRVLTVAHAFITVQGLVLDGQFGADDLVRVGSAATGLT